MALPLVCGCGEGRVESGNYYACFAASVYLLVIYLFEVGLGTSITLANITDHFPPSFLAHLLSFMCLFLLMFS